MKRSLIVEDDPEARQWMAGVVVDAFPKVTASAVPDLASGREALTGCSFDLAVIDINLPDGSGIDLVREITTACPDTYCVVATIFGDDQHIFSALKAGAHGYILKDQARERLIKRLRGIAQGEPPLSASVARRILRYFQRPSASPADAGLSTREQEVLTLIGKGYSRSEIAELLHISPNTAASYVKTVYQKLNVSSRAEAALEAVRFGLIRTD